MLADNGFDSTQVTGLGDGSVFVTGVGTNTVELVVLGDGRTATMQLSAEDAQVLIDAIQAVIEGRA